MEIGRLGVWSFIDAWSAPDAAAFAKRVEEWGYSALWIPEAVGRNALVASSWLLANTSKLIIATGIANIYARDPIAMAAAQLSLAEQSGNRFLLGLGVSHAPLVEGLRGHAYSNKPVARMRDYLEGMKKLAYVAPRPTEVPKTVLAALGPKMIELGASDADGIHPYNVTPRHTAKARALIGPGKWLCVEQAVILETDPERARSIARSMLRTYLPLDNYRNNWVREGFSEEDLAGEGSDRFIDEIIAWGDEAAIRARIQAHWDAGADHVCIQALNPDGSPQADETALARLAPKSG
ncbi:TIGR03620 family F420-dependent LLM class oxidoreductase [Flavisphingomonas formosensis]|uniref:TIGR03620 family F420-dependent LLM class oxidoreductase n=1 Tax=Flavisphingomonas formosensis TaxID=861534 RepID=UPI0018DF9CB8|nr:TIGR03620 family F420-dependent LLM class oxidoreductase [Sphingomonas formosensis]